MEEEWDNVVVFIHGCFVFCVGDGPSGFPSQQPALYSTQHQHKHSHQEKAPVRKSDSQRLGFHSAVFIQKIMDLRNNLTESLGIFFQER